MKKMDANTVKEFENEYKLAMTSTIDDEGYPHLTLINTLSAKNESELISGEFIIGLSKKFMQERNKIGFIVVNFNKDWWTGTAAWKEKKNTGEEYDRLNQIPMFRYNTYLGIHTVHYYALNEISEQRKLDMAGIIANAVYNMAVKPFLKAKDDADALNKWSYDLMRGLATLKFLSFIGEDGFPRVYPTIQAQACDHGRISIPLHPYSKELAALQDNSKIAMMGATMGMDSVLVKGIFKKSRTGLGYMDIERVYNTMPPKHGYIYTADEANIAYQ